MTTPADPTKFLESCLWALIDANDDAALTQVSRCCPSKP
jgi:hypothetical protein